MGPPSPGNGKATNNLMALLGLHISHRFNVYSLLEALYELFGYSSAEDALAAIAACLPALGKANCHWPQPQDTLGKKDNPGKNLRNAPHIPRGPNIGQPELDYSCPRSPNRTGSPIHL